MLRTCTLYDSLSCLLQSVRMSGMVCFLTFCISLQAISEEYKRRERERELMMKKRIGEYSELETQLRSTLDELEARQKIVIEKERQIDRLGTQLQREHEDKLNQARNEARRMVDDAEHKVV